MYYYELQDVIFLIKSLKSPTDNFNIHRYITFARGNTSNQKLTHPRTPSTVQHHYYFNRIYNYLLVIDLSLSTGIPSNKPFSAWSHFTNYFNPERACTFHLLCPCRHCCKDPISTNFYQLHLIITPHVQ